MIIIDGVPIAKKRPRFSRQGNRVRTFSCQKHDEAKIKWELQKQMADKQLLKCVEAPISVQMSIHTPIPKTWSQKRLKEVLGKPDITRPDIDNYAKAYLDAMNGIVYGDDNQVTELWCEKIYSDKPKVIISIFEKNRYNMIQEHASTVKKEITIEDLEYMVKKANRLGLIDRQLVRCFMQEDSEGRHIYFEVEGMKNGSC